MQVAVSLTGSNAGHTACAVVFGFLQLCCLIRSFLFFRTKRVAPRSASFGCRHSTKGTLPPLGLGFHISFVCADRKPAMRICVLGLRYSTEVCPYSGVLFRCSLQVFSCCFFLLRTRTPATKICILGFRYRRDVYLRSDVMTSRGAMLADPGTCGAVGMAHRRRPSAH